MSAAATTLNGADRASELARSLDYLSEQDLCELAGITPATAQSWRKHGRGPDYVLAGTTYLYARTEVARWLASLTRDRAQRATGAVL